MSATAPTGSGKRRASTMNFTERRPTPKGCEAIGSFRQEERILLRSEILTRRVNESPAESIGRALRGETGAGIVPGSSPRRGRRAASCGLTEGAGGKYRVAERLAFERRKGKLNAEKRGGGR